MRPRFAIDRLDLVSNCAGVLGTLGLFALVLSIHPPQAVEPADAGAAATEIALDVSAEPDSSDPPQAEPPQDAPMEAPQPAVVEDTPPPTPEPSPIVARPKPAQPERPKPKAPEERSRARAERASESKRETRDKAAAAAPRRGEPSESTRPSQASGNVSAFRSCLAGAPYPTSKDARLQKPSGSVGIAVSGGSASVTRSSGSAILDSAARSRAAACASAAGGGSLSGVVVFHPR